MNSDTLAAIAYALLLSAINIALALVFVQFALKHEELSRFFRVVLSSMTARTVCTIVAFGCVITLTRVDTFVFSLTFILGYAVMLGIEIVIIHHSQQRYDNKLRDSALAGGLQRRTNSG